MDKQWSCVMASEKYSKREHIPIVINSIKKIVGKNVEIFYIDNKNEKSFDGYFFVKKDLTDLAYEFKNNVYFQNILNSFERVELISDHEISKMKESVEKKHNKFFKYGDVLFIKRGVYENLRGICLSVNENDCDVGMKFCTGSFIIKIDKIDLNVEDNIFNHIRKPFHVYKRH